MADVHPDARLFWGYMLGHIDIERARDAYKRIGPEAARHMVAAAVRASPQMEQHAHRLDALEESFVSGKQREQLEAFPGATLCAPQQRYKPRRAKDLSTGEWVAVGVSVGFAAIIIVLLAVFLMQKPPAE